MTSPLFVIMTRPPRTGKNKTRLLPTLGPDLTAALHEAMLTDVLDTVASTPLDMHICVAGDPQHAFFDPWKPRATIEAQTEGDLGARLRAALRDGATRKVIALGADAPTLPTALLHALAMSEQQVTIVPAKDGGYVSIALNGPHWGIFEDIEWSTDRVLKQTLERTKALELTIAVLPEWYDIDEAEDLEHLSTELRNLPADTAPHTRAVLERRTQ